MSLNPFYTNICECVCALHPRFPAWFHSMLAVSARGLLFIVRTAWHPALSRAHALSACDRNVGFPPNTQEGINKEEHLQIEVSSTSAILKIDDVGPRFSGSKKQVALRDSLHLGEIWRMEWHCSWLPDSSFVLVWVAVSQMSVGELYLN